MHIPPSRWRMNLPLPPKIDGVVFAEVPIDSVLREKIQKHMVHSHIVVTSDSSRKKRNTVIFGTLKLLLMRNISTTEGTHSTKGSG